jgi:dTDP-4-dehydrorhamnose 3,5-epimerase
LENLWALHSGSEFVHKIDTTIPGVFELTLKIFRDSRGFFLETYHQARYAELGISEKFVQDNHSASAKGTLRGLHYQLRHAQAKLCRVVEGEALDVAVDIRVGSPHFGKWVGVILSSQKQNQIYIPAGFAHGFLALTETVQFLYKCNEYYDPKDEYGILWNDPEIGISWGVSSPVLSEKDSRYSPLAGISRELLPKYSTK